MAVQMICPNVRCGHIHHFPDEARGQVITCLRCETQFRIPSTRKAAPSTAAQPRYAQAKAPAAPVVF